MSYELTETLAEPVLEGLQLEIDGELVAIAKPVAGSTIGNWRIELGRGIFVGVRTAGHAREFLGWLGDKLTPLTEITGPDDLDRAPIGALWQSEYPANAYGGTIKNRYRLTEEGHWEYQASDDGRWISCKDTNDGGPFHQAYPLTLVSA